MSRKGQINAPGISPSSKKAVEEQLLLDAQTHHCFFRSAGLHNHLSHHLLAAYDLGATAGHLKKIYDEEARVQRPILLEEKDASIVVNDDNWVQHLGKPSAYGAFVKFFCSKVQDLGPTGALEKYVFEEAVNKQGTLMLVRMMSGALHPFIQIGYGAEFGNDTLIATGLAQAAVHGTTAPQIFKFRYDEPGQGTQESGLSVLEILRRVYDSEILHPVMPYDPNALINTRLRDALKDGRAEEILKLCDEFHVDTSSGEIGLSSKVEEFIWTSTLLMSATGREGKKPRLDFFLMHLVTSSLFLSPLIRLLNNPVAKANLLRAFLPAVILYTLARGRPRINPDLLMASTATPRPPMPSTSLYNLTPSSLGSPLEDAEYNPWPAILGDVIYHPDAHVVKAMRTLAFAAQHYGATSPGAAVGSFRPGGGTVETHKGTGAMDGTIFVRAAGMVMDYMGWVAHGQAARAFWDTSALGWDAAWDDED